MRTTLPFTEEQVQTWKETYPTPFYIYDEQAIRENVRGVYKAFSWNEGFREYFAVKACPTPGILRILHEEGCGFDCASVTEVMLASASGAGKHEIMFSSNETSDQEYLTAVSAGAIINLDDLTQIDHLRRSAGIPDTVCMRYNPGTFAMTNDIMGHQYDSKFGMTKEQLFESIRILKKEGVQNFGIHAMLASCSLENVYYPSLARELFTLVLEIRDELGVTLSFIDLSGGIGIPYRPHEKAVDMAAIGGAVHAVYDELLAANGISLKIFTEMGRYITGPYGYLVTSVIGEKHIYKNYVGVDATACDLMRPAMYGAYHHITVLGKETDDCTYKADVVGSLCENNDKFAVDRELPVIEQGDLLVIQDAGAHGRSMGYNYNGKLRCGELLMHADGSISQIRRPEKPADYFATLDVDDAFAKKLAELKK